MVRYVEDHLRPELPWEHNFRKQLVRLRTARGWTQTDVAKSMKAAGFPFHQQTIQRVESGERPARVNEAKYLADLFGVDLGTMLETAADPETEIRWAVDRLRRVASTQAGVLTDSLERVSDAAGNLTYAIMTRWPGGADDVGHDGQLYELPAAEDIDEVSRWGLLWAEHARWAWRSLYNARVALQAMAGETPDEEVDWVNVQFEEWSKHFGTAGQRSADTNELYDSFPEGEQDNGEQQHA